MDDFQKRTHILGRVWTFVGILLMVAVPFIVMAYFGVPPSTASLFAGVLSLSIMQLPGALIELMTYAPMLGSGATYLAFITGNLVNLKIPCAINSRELTGVAVGSEENEIVSTLSVATSAIVTTLVITLGVILIIPLKPIISSAALAPAFGSVVPALFGALGFVHFSKNPKVAIAPMVIMLAICFLVPAAASQVSVLVPFAAIISIGGARLMYQKGIIQ